MQPEMPRAKAEQFVDWYLELLRDGAPPFDVVVFWNRLFAYPGGREYSTKNILLAKGFVWYHRLVFGVGLPFGGVVVLVNNYDRPLRVMLALAMIVVGLVVLQKAFGLKRSFASPFKLGKSCFLVEIFPPADFETEYFVRLLNSPYHSCFGNTRQAALEEMASLLEEELEDPDSMLQHYQIIESLLDAAEADEGAEYELLFVEPKETGLYA